jgi:hypothetical protein
MQLKLLIVLILSWMVVSNAKSQTLAPQEQESLQHLSIIRIVSQNNGGKCTAFVINDKQAITAAHCVEDEPESLFDFWSPEDKFDVYNSKGVKTTIVAKVEKKFDDVDIAILKGDFKDFKKLPVEKGFHLFLKEPILACGYAGGFKELECTTGYYAGAVYFDGLMTNYLAKGMSGGPVINQYGRVIGVNNSKREDGFSAFAVLFGNISVE